MDGVSGELCLWPFYVADSTFSLPSVHLGRGGCVVRVRVMGVSTKWLWGAGETGVGWRWNSLKVA